MTDWERRWIALCAYMIAVWHKPISEDERVMGMRVLGRLPIEAVENAVTELTEAGGEYLPPWSQIYAKASAIAKDLRPALPPSDMVRPLTDEERERAARMGALLRGSGVVAIQETWMAFARHARRKVAGPKRTFTLEYCPVCEAVASIVRKGGKQSDYYATLEVDCCHEGRPLYSAWRRAVTDLVRQAFPREQIA